MKPNRNSSPPRLWTFLARGMYLVLFAAGIMLTLLSLPENLDAESYICTYEPCRYEAVYSDELQPLEQFGLTPDRYVLYRFWFDVPPVLILFMGASLLIFLARSDEWIGLLSATFLLTFPTAILTGDFTTTAAFLALPNWLGQVVYGFSSLFAVIGGATLVVLFYVFPNGKFVPSWTRWLAPLPLIWSAYNVYLSSWVKLPVATYLFGNWFYLLLMVIAFLAQIFRYWRISSPTQRQQTKWVIVAVIMMPVSDLLIRGLLNQLLPIASQPGPGRVIWYMISIPILRTIPFMLVPISFTFAILRYRLWDIDILIRRTLQYSLLTAVLAGIYLMSIVLLQAVFSILGGEQSALVTVFSTLVIAALFNPLRRRIQEAIDRRFYRQKYDAEKTLATFAQTTRSEVEIDLLTGELLEVVQETFSPTSIGLWIKPKD